MEKVIRVTRFVLATVAVGAFLFEYAVKLLSETLSSDPFESLVSSAGTQDLQIALVVTSARIAGTLDHEHEAS